MQVNSNNNANQDYYIFSSTFLKTAAIVILFCISFSAKNNVQDNISVVKCANDKQ